MEEAPFMVLQEKLKRVKMSLGPCSKATFGNVLQQIATMKDVVKVKKYI